MIYISKTALHRAVEKEAIDIIKVLLTNTSIDTNAEDTIF